MSDKSFNQAHLNKMFNSMRFKIIKSLKQNRSKFRMKRLLKIKKFNKLLKTRMKFIKKFKKFLSKWIQEMI